MADISFCSRIARGLDDAKQIVRPAFALVSGHRVTRTSASDGDSQDGVNVR